MCRVAPQAGAPKGPASQVVTKGSFYWHFTDRQDLMDSLFEYWDSSETAHRIEQVETTLTSPAERIWTVVREVTLGDYDVAIEVAMRHWAYQDESIRLRLEKVDSQRIAFFARQFVELGFTNEEASLRAYKVYSITLVREFMQTGESFETLQSCMRASVEMLIGTTLEKAAG